jgi:exodeoxyribonuclease VII small subunit
MLVNMVAPRRISHPQRPHRRAVSLTPLARLPHSGVMTADPAIDDLSFEQALAKLEAIVTRLESGDTPLDEAIGLYELGNKLRRRCADRLDAAQARIEAIRLDAEGRPTGTAPFDAG